MRLARPTQEGCFACAMKQPRVLFVKRLLGVRVVKAPRIRGSGALPCGGRGRGDGFADLLVVGSALYEHSHSSLDFVYGCCRFPVGRKRAFDHQRHRPCLNYRSGHRSSPRDDVYSQSQTQAYLSVVVLAPPLHASEGKGGISRRGQTLEFAQKS